jgi:transposase
MTLAKLLFPQCAGLRVDRVWRDGATIHLRVSLVRRRARCPLCGRRSRRRHPQYERTLVDLPCGRDGVVLHVRVRRFVCRVCWCRRKVFAERLPDLAAPFARRTARLMAACLRTAFDLGGEPGARHLTAEGTAVSARTLLRLVRAAAVPAVGTVRALGVDDWSRRKGRDFGTILVDLEQQRIIDLLPDRTADTLAAWLRGHPELEVVSRDRAGAYAEGIRQGAPQAQQVADRFHLHKNATGALERYLIRQHAALRQAAGAVAAHESPAAAAPPPSAEPTERRARRLARYEAMMAVRARGATCRTIALRLGVSERTVQRWLRIGYFPERRRRSERPGQLSRHAPDLQARWSAGCHNATRLYQELRARGFRGSYESVAAFVAPWRDERYRYRGQVRTRRPPRPAADALATPRRVCWLLLRSDGDLTAAEHTFRSHLYTVCPQVACAEALVKDFARVLRERDVDGLYAWSRVAQAGGIAELQALVRSIWIDRPAVEAAVRLAWSNGQAEGSVNKLKLTKRAMYGRAKFDLLRQRLLHAA